MKQNITLSLAIAGIAAILGFSSCKKDMTYETASGGSTSSTRSYATTAYATTYDRIDEIMKDLSQDSYSFSFDQTYPNSSITRTAYGADNYLVFARPGDLIVPDPLAYRYKQIPLWKRPNFIVPTCPDMSIDLSRLRNIQDLIVKADPNRFTGLKTVNLLNGGGLLATDRAIYPYSKLQTDRVDGITKDLDLSRFIMLGAPDLSNGGVFTRNFYGFSDLNELIFKPYRTNLRDILKPTLKGCFDPLILKTIRERLVSLNPNLYGNLVVSPLAQNSSMATLSY